ncbi:MULTISPECIES: class I adenylate-forming enzyme family protein [unclassified Nocardioides]|uniref:class I adenylate-forming enzyme family protein n=1 Tax=unclassified Nocardioides TaxID=2615069 RepID=UPI0007034426|nr:MULTISPECIES: AMP-binding protein [unclassified Nocardioides]KRC54126.1 long-chain fatty acid--CoA ligase [Nocardioides sp. Root79]KRC71462.1 long-chain fatty acid--CoA ligase [Nocardioides sp. Root240]
MPVLTTSYLPADNSPGLVELTVPALLAQRAAEHPDRLALVGTRHGDGAEVRLTYAELHDEAARVATALRRLARPGDHVALWAPNVVEWVVLQHGAALAGVVLVALNPVLRLAELEYALDHSRASVLLHADRSRDHDMAAVAQAAAAGRPHLRVVSLADRATWQAQEADPVVVGSAPTDPDLPVMLQYTSGTTGNPKGVLLRHRSLVNVARLTVEYVDVPAGAVTINPLPMFHTAACVIGTLGPLWLGGTEVLVEQFAALPVLETMRREQVEVLFFVPAVLGALLEAQRALDQPPPRLAVALGGASNLPATMIEATEQVFGAAVTNLFGQTELAPVLTATRPGDTREDKLRTVGHPLPHVDVKVVDPASGEVVPIGVAGEICARGYQQMVEYLHDPAATAATVDADGFVHMGDLGSMDERGYLTLTGRLKDIIIRGGENIAPAGVETCLAEHPAVVGATVFGLPDDRMGEVVAAAVHLREDVTEAELVAHCRERLSPYKVPTRWFVAGELPVTPTGKVQKFRLAALVGTPALRELTI